MDEEEVELPLVAKGHTLHQVVLTRRKGKELSSYSCSLTKNPNHNLPKKQQQGLALGDTISTICWFTHTQINHILSGGRCLLPEQMCRKLSMLLQRQKSKSNMSVLQTNVYQGVG